MMISNIKRYEYPHENDRSTSSLYFLYLMFHRGGVKQREVIPSGSKEERIRKKGRKSKTFTTQIDYLDKALTIK